MTNSHVLHLRVLGCEITLRFKSSTAADQARLMFGSMETAPWRSPDVLIDCAWPALTREFIRSRLAGEKVLKGIRVYSAEQPCGAEWNSMDPPFPPVNLRPFRDRFVRLHAGAVVNKWGDALLILGESGYGKTTLCIQLVENYGYLLLTDEDSFLHRRTSLVEPYPVSFTPWKRDAESSDTTRLQGRLRQSAAEAQGLILLRQHGSPSLKLMSINARVCLRALLAAQRPGGSEHSEAIATLVPLARAAKAAELDGGQYERLLAAAGCVAAFGDRSL